MKAPASHRVDPEVAERYFGDPTLAFLVRSVGAEVGRVGGADSIVDHYYRHPHGFVIVRAHELADPYFGHATDLISRLGGLPDGGGEVAINRALSGCPRDEEGLWDGRVIRTGIALEGDYKLALVPANSGILYGFTGDTPRLEGDPDETDSDDRVATFTFRTPEEVTDWFRCLESLHRQRQAVADSEA